MSMISNSSAGIKTINPTKDKATVRKKIAAMISKASANKEITPNELLSFADIPGIFNFQLFKSEKIVEGIFRYAP